MPANPSPSWASRLVRWAIVDPWLVWLAVITPLLLLVPIGVAFTCEPRVRFAGMTFQLMGLVTAVWGLRDDRKLFREPTAFQRLGLWMRAFPRRRPHPLPLPGDAGELVPQTAAIPPPEPTRDLVSLEESIASLHQAARRQAADLLVLSNDLRILGQKARKAFLRERSIRETADREISAKLHDAVAGDLPFDLIGVVYFLLGTVLGSTSIELAPLLFGPACLG
jgi:hypothetical protein